MSRYTPRGGRRPPAVTIVSFDHITTYRQYSMMPDEARERMFLQWCTRLQRDPELEGNADLFFDSLDQTEPEETPDAVLVDLFTDENPDSDELDQSWEEILPE